MVERRYVLRVPSGYVTSEKRSGEWFWNVTAERWAWKTTPDKAQAYPFHSLSEARHVSDEYFGGRGVMVLVTLRGGK